ncbi:hypothetical protein ACW2Q0_28360 [Nocardia sp. R16R-3T]
MDTTTGLADPGPGMTLTAQQVRPKDPGQLVAVQWCGRIEHTRDVIGWIVMNGGTVTFVFPGQDHPMRRPNESPRPSFLAIDSDGGPSRVDIGDWILRVTTGHFFAMTPAGYADTYEPISVAARAHYVDECATAALTDQLADELYPDEALSAYRRYKANAPEETSPTPAPVAEPSPPIAGLVAVLVEQLQLSNVIAALTATADSLELVNGIDVQEAEVYVRAHIGDIINPPRD